MVKPITYGRMGNFLFQAAAAIAYALRHGLEYTLPNTTTKPKGNPIYLQHLVNPAWNPALPEVLIEEGKKFDFRELPFKEEWREKNIILDGYWQSEKYFKEFRQAIRQAFGFPWEMKPGVVSVHVRRGDFVTLTKKHPPVPKEWMEGAMARFPGARFVFYSDDIPWCLENFKDRDDVGFSGGMNEVDDLISMSCAEHHICSASTFSWWGAWLNENPGKRVIMPKLWFVPGYQGLETKDIVPEEWERI